MIPWDALQIQGSVGQLTLGIITKLCLSLGDSGLTIASRVNQTGRAEWHLGRVGGTGFGVVRAAKARLESQGQAAPLGLE